MGVTRKDIHTDTTLFAADTLKAIAHPVRFLIMTILKQRGSVTVGELAEETTLAQSTLSQHLVVLKTHNMIIGTPSGPAVHYQINRPAWSQVKDLLRLLAEEM